MTCTCSAWVKLVPPEQTNDNILKTFISQHYHSLQDLSLPGRGCQRDAPARVVYGRMRHCLLAAALTPIDTAVQGNRAAAPQARTLVLPPKAAQRRATACCANGRHAHEELHDLEVAAYHHGMQTVASLAQPVARQCYGGPPPFGLGLGLARVRACSGTQRGTAGFW